MHSEYSIRQFQPADWEVYKSIRLEALQSEPGVFCASYDEQSQLPDEHWQERLADHSFAYFGLYCGEELVGMSGVARNTHNVDEAELIASYIKPGHRLKGLSQLYYKARIEWAKTNGIKCLIVSHRKSNISSKGANQKFGFQFTHSVLRMWHDKKWEDNVYYELML